MHMRSQAAARFLLRASDGALGSVGRERHHLLEHIALPGVRLHPVAQVNLDFQLGVLPAPAHALADGDAQHVVGVRLQELVGGHGDLATDPRDHANDSLLRPLNQLEENVAALVDLPDGLADGIRVRDVPGVVALDDVQHGSNFASLNGEPTDVGAIADGADDLPRAGSLVGADADAERPAIGEVGRVEGPHLRRVDRHVQDLGEVTPEVVPGTAAGAIKHLLHDVAVRHPLDLDAFPLEARLDVLRHARPLGEVAREVIARHAPRGHRHGGLHGLGPLVPIQLADVKVVAL
mmetsp:Transcript_65137/g.199202  ORF Transcript_65137/g.199202 Transcript_65137/m.199202 type:complete len:292 (+) Transcript_65137:1832-2707(+)